MKDESICSLCGCKDCSILWCKHGHCQDCEVVSDTIGKPGMLSVDIIEGQRVCDTLPHSPKLNTTRKWFS